PQTARPLGDDTTAEFIVVPAAVGASRLWVGRDTKAIVAEHRSWLREVYRERADEAPGVLVLVSGDGAAARTLSGWALGGPTPDGAMAWLEELDSEYTYRVSRTTGPGGLLTPPGDYWAVAATTGHWGATLGAAVLWQPALGTSSADPRTRRDELFIAA